MADYLLKVSRNALLDRLRVLQSDLTGENRHSDAMTVDFVIQILGGDASTGKVGRHPQDVLGAQSAKNWMAM